MAIFNLCTRKYLTNGRLYDHSCYYVGYQLEIAYRCFAVDLFPRRLNTRTAVVHLPLLQLGFLVPANFAIVLCDGSTTL